MNINFNKNEIIKNLDLNIKYLEKNKKDAINELNKCLITLLTSIDKPRLKYLFAKIKYLLACLFNDELTNNYIEILKKELLKLQQEFLVSSTKQVREEEKAYLSYWYKQISLYTKQIAHLKLQRKELESGILYEKNLYELGTLEEIDTYKRNKYQKEDNLLINKGLIKYKIKEGYLGNSKDIKDFIKELRHNFLYLISKNNHITLDNVESVYNIAYQMTVRKYETEPVVKPSMKHMLKYLRKHNQILINENTQIITDISELDKKYTQECFDLFSHLMQKLNYIDIDEIARIFQVCCNAVSEEMNYYPEKPLSLKRMLPKTLKYNKKNKMQN